MEPVIVQPQPPAPVPGPAPNYSVVRPLGLSEKYQLSKQLAGIFGSILGSMQIKVTEKQFTPISKDYCFKILYHALNQLVHSIPQLSYAVIDHHTDQPKFVHIAPFDLAKSFKVSNHDFKDLQVVDRLEQDICNFDFDIEATDRPQWYLQAVLCDRYPDEFYLIWSANHVITDGVGMLHILKSIVETANSGDFHLRPDQLVDSFVKPPNGFQSTGVLEHYNPYHIKDEVADVQEQSQSNLPAMLHQRPITGQYWSGVRAAQQEKHKTRIKTIRIEPRAFELVSKKCREMKVTTHSALYNCIIMSLLEIFGVGRAHTMEFRTSTPFNARPYCKPVVPSSDVGMYIGSIVRDTSMSLDTIHSAFWEHCRDYMQYIKTGHVQGLRHVSVLEYVGTFPEDYTQGWFDRIKSLPMGRGCSFIFSDVGKVVIPHKGDSSKHWDVQALHCSQSSFVSGCGFIATASSTNVGGLNLAISYQKMDFTKHEINLLMNTLKKNILNIPLYQPSKL